MGTLAGKGLKAFSEIFSGRRHQNSSLFSSVFFPAELILSNVSAKATLGRSGSMLPENFLKICILQWPF